MKAILPASHRTSSPITDAKTADAGASAYDIVPALRAEETAMTHTRPFGPALFGEAAIDAETAKLKAQMVQLLADQPDLWIIGAEAFRAARRRGEGPFPAPVMSSRARTLTITGKDGGPCRMRRLCSGREGDGCNDPYLDEEVEPLALTEQEIDDLVAFLTSLTSAQHEEQGDGERARQRETAGTNRPQREIGVGLWSQTASTSATRALIRTLTGTSGRFRSRW
jgi:hypothetical protein